MTSAQEIRAVGWERDAHHFRALANTLARQNRQLRATLTEGLTMDLETAIRAALKTYRERYRQLPIPAADDEATTTILAACRAETDRAIAADRAETGKTTAARRTTRRTTTAKR